MNTPQADNKLGLDREILDGFKSESNQLLQELTQVVEKLEVMDTNSEFPSQLMEEFSQRIDRIMGAAKTLAQFIPFPHPGLNRIGRLSELCKHIGYKATETKKSRLLPIFSAFWMDTIEVIGNLLDAVEDLDKTEQIAQAFSAVLQKRLEWLSKKIAPEVQQSSQDEINQLLKDLAGGF